MKIHMLTRARRLWTSPFASDQINRSNQLKWVRAVRMLGDKWLLASYVQRKESQ